MSKRRKFSASFKTKVVLESLKERKTIGELADHYKIHPTQINTWKREFLSRADQVFEGNRKSEKSQEEQEKDALLRAIGELKVENDFLKNALR